MANKLPIEKTEVDPSADGPKQQGGQSCAPFQTTIAVNDARPPMSSRSPKRGLSSNPKRDPLLGAKVDTYWVRAVLGQGGMGRVYLAWHERLERLCALKVVLPELVEADPSRLHMFFSEARSSAKLHHPHVVSIHTVGDDGGLHFIEMEFVHGRSLRQVLDQEKRLGPAEATRFVAQIASALAAAHDHGVVHCDVKPDNVMVTPGRQAKLGDFGLARAYADRNRRGVVGTPPYIAPEVYCEKPATFASDVYALGATYYMLLTGQPPFIASSLQEMRDHHLFSAPPRIRDVLPDVPAEICDLIRAMMAKSPNQRPTCGPTFVDNLYGLANSLVPLEKLVAEAMQDLDVQWGVEESRYVFDVALAGGRRQVVFAEIIESEGPQGSLFSFWTPCAPAAANDYEYVLKMNARLPFGTVSLRDYKGRPYFVMVENHSRADIAPVDIRTSVIHLSIWADRIENTLTGHDVH